MNIDSTDKPNHSSKNLISGQYFDTTDTLSNVLIVSDTKNESLQYLSLDQVMADTAAFIRYFKSSRPEFANAKIILLGFSYSGGLSTWFQHVNPGLVDGVWSSSGVVFPSADNDRK